MILTGQSQYYVVNVLSKYITAQLFEIDQIPKNWKGPDMYYSKTICLGSICFLCIDVLNSGNKTNFHEIIFNH